MEKNKPGIIQSDHGYLTNAKIIINTYELQHSQIADANQLKNIDRQNMFWAVESLK